MKVDFVSRLYRWFFSAALLGLTGLLMNSCKTPGGGVTDTGYGPFDSRGNYVEAWADQPSKWHRRSSFAGADATPDLAIASGNDAPPSDLSPMAQSSSRPVEVARLSRSSTQSKSAAPSSSRKSSTSVARSKTSSAPRTTRVVIRRGDTLSGLAARHRTSVRAIQRANGMRDTRLVAGKTLVIPRL